MSELPVPIEMGVVASQAREEHELKALFVVAYQRGRDERQCFDKVMVSCERPSFADGATYSFPRGGAQVAGPSVKLAREIARCWGGMSYELRIVDQDAESVHIRGIAIDLVAGTRVAMEDRFAKKIQRKLKSGETKWIEPDERDLRELINRRGAICVRNALLQLFPPDLVEDAQERAQATLESAASGDLEKNRAETIKALLASFKSAGVTQDQIEGLTGRPIQDITPTEVAKLRTIYTSLKDGMTRPSDHFEGAGEVKVVSKSTEEVKDRLAKAAKGNEKPTKPAQDRVQDAEVVTTTPEAQDAPQAATKAQNGAQEEKAGDEPDQSVTDDVSPDQVLKLIPEAEAALAFTVAKMKKARTEWLGTADLTAADPAKASAYYRWLYAAIDQSEPLV